MEIYVEVIGEPEIVNSNRLNGTFLESFEMRHAFYRAMWNGEEIIVGGTGSFIDTLPSVGSRGLIIGTFGDQRFRDENGDTPNVPYFFVKN